jgi:aminopeptidase N
MFTMGNAGRDAGVLREARRLTNLHLTGAAPLGPSMVDTALELAAIEGDAVLYDQYVSRMRASSTPAEQAQYLAALSFFTNQELQKRTLAYATSEDIRTQDAPTLIRFLMQRPWAADATWAHLKNNWDRIARALGIFQGVPNVIGSLQHLCDANAKNDIEQFFALHPVAGADRTIRQSLETIDRCTATKAAQSKNLAAFLARP